MPIRYNVSMLLREGIGATRDYEVANRVLIDEDEPRHEEVTGRAAFASWAFDGTSSTRLDYGDLSVVTGGKTGAFSCFCTVRLDAVDGSDQFFFGKLTTSDKGWKLGLLDRRAAAATPTGSLSELAAAC